MTTVSMFGDPIVVRLGSLPVTQTMLTTLAVSVAVVLAAALLRQAVLLTNKMTWVGLHVEGGRGRVTLPTSRRHFNDYLWEKDAGAGPVVLPTRPAQLAT